MLRSKVEKYLAPHFYISRFVGETVKRMNMGNTTTTTERLINIRTDKFTKEEIRVIEDSIKEWNYDWIVNITYVGDNQTENLDVTFTLNQEDLGEFLWVVFGCGTQFAYGG